ncbi:response regulator transcription factor [Leifsonia kafniensis]|uniref:Response regulator transcription factor n=1 Tax=Leifsonia kafniensis TaxID=475957 RepID=A0ABP7K763_9MICO
MPTPDQESNPIRILVVDDDALAAAGITALLSTADDLSVVGHCLDGIQVAHAIRSLAPDVMLCDVRMPGMGGVDVVRSLHGQAGAPRILMMTAFDEDGQVLDAVAAGAVGFLLKDEDPHRIIEAVRDVAAGDAGYSPRAARQLTQWVQDSPTADARRDALEKLGLLTDREHDFALALVTGASDAELAAQFFVAETTVKSALSAIKTKWGIRNRTQLAVVVARSGLA